MANVIRHKRGTSNPAAGDFSQTAELLVNTSDGGLFTKTDGGSVVEISGDKLPLSGGTMTGDLVVTTGQSNGIFWGSAGPNITNVAAQYGDLSIQNIDQLRFGSSSAYNWNEWAGIGFNSSTEVLTIGGPNSSAFTSNASPPNITINFDGLSGTNGLTYEGSTIWHAGNDGSGSGLDADTVDGIEASAFYQADTALSATTGAFSGDVTMSGTGALKVANGTTAQRPTAATGQIRYNTTLGALESYVSGAWQVIANTALDYGLITSASDTTFDYGALS